ncbi:MAG TPA: alcohol dehydrogenase catalytic domain-containing protein, partial [Thermoleophilia bacterium]|nr:alcohol dehydrogenase catalytic domain-containing protein [Thermoleophilia bacterium]
MRAMLLRSPRQVGERPLELIDLPRPQPGPGELLIEVHACGICHTDLHIVEGELSPHRSPVVPGHQIVGEVVAVGEGVVASRVGSRVGVPWLWRTDGTCGYCRRGDENLCENALFTGYDVDGGFAEYVVAPDAFSYALPEGMDDLAAAPLLCAGIIGYRCLRLVGVTGGAGLPGRSREPRAGAGIAGSAGSATIRSAGSAVSEASTDDVGWDEGEERGWERAGRACCGMPGDAIVPPAVVEAEEGRALGGGAEAGAGRACRLGLY